MDIIEILKQRLASLDSDRQLFDFHAAVIVPLLELEDRIEVLLEKRAGDLRRSSGEVSFPGGRIEEEEEPYQAGLRELEEEVGIPTGQVTLLGRLPDLQRSRRERITPFVCSVSGEVHLRLQEREVEEVFLLPLDFLIRHGFEQAKLIEEHSLSADFPSRYLPGGRWKRRLVHPVRYLIYKDNLIWGLTAEILFRLLELLK